MGTLAVVERVLRENAKPLSVKEIVKRAGAELPTRSRTPDTVVSRDLSMDIKRYGESSKFIRTSPGRYTLRAFATTSHETSGDLPDQSLSHENHKNSNQIDSIVSQSLNKNPIGVIASKNKSSGKENVESESEEELSRLISK